MGADVIQRWFTCGYGSGLIPDERGDVVTYDDHAAALAEKGAEVERLKKALDQAIERAMLYAEDSLEDSDLRVARYEVNQKLVVWNSRTDCDELNAYLKEKGQ